MLAPWHHASSTAAAELKAVIGEHLGYSDWMEITQERVNQFADATGDHQWIHVDVERAKKESPFGGPIAHGYLTLSLAPVLMPQVVHHHGLHDGRELRLQQGALHVARAGRRQAAPGREAARVDDIAGGVQSTYELTFEMRRRHQAELRRRGASTAATSEHSCAGPARGVPDVGAARVGGPVPAGRHPGRSGVAPVQPLPQRGRGQHHLLRVTARANGGEVGGARPPGLPLRVQGAAYHHPRSAPARRRRRTGGVREHSWHRSVLSSVASPSSSRLRSAPATWQRSPGCCSGCPRSGDGRWRCDIPTSTAAVAVARWRRCCAATTPSGCCSTPPNCSTARPSLRRASKNGAPNRECR